MLMVATRALEAGGGALIEAVENLAVAVATEGFAGDRITLCAMELFSFW